MDKQANPVLSETNDAVVKGYFTLKSSPNFVGIKSPLMVAPMTHQLTGLGCVLVSVMRRIVVIIGLASTVILIFNRLLYYMDYDTLFIYDEV